MSFLFLNEQQFERTNIVNCGIPQAEGTGSGFIKVLITGEIASAGHDRKLMLRLNGATSGYRSLARYGNDDGEWGTDDGLYVCRSAWGQDGTFTVDYTIGYYPGAQKITGCGLSVFAAGVDIEGFESHGYLLGNGPVRNIEIVLQGGLINGHLSYIVCRNAKISGKGQSISYGPCH